MNKEHKMRTLALVLALGAIVLFLLFEGDNSRDAVTMPESTMSPSEQGTNMSWKSPGGDASVLRHVANVPGLEGAKRERDVFRITAVGATGSNLLELKFALELDSTVHEGRDGFVSWTGPTFDSVRGLLVAPDHLPQVVTVYRGRPLRVTLTPCEENYVQVVRREDSMPIPRVECSYFFERRQEKWLENALALVGMRNFRTDEEGLAQLYVCHLVGAGTPGLVLRASERVEVVVPRLLHQGRVSIVAMDRPNARKCIVRFVDAEGSVLANRPVEVSVHGYATKGRTDEKGAFEWKSVPYRPSGLTFEQSAADLRVVIDLVSGSRFVHREALPERTLPEEVLVVVETVIVRGRMIHELPEEFSVAIFSSSELGEVRADAFWQRLSKDGEFHLRSGWYSKAPYLVVRHDDTKLHTLFERLVVGQGRDQPFLELSAPPLSRLVILNKGDIPKDAVFKSQLGASNTVHWPISDMISDPRTVIRGMITAYVTRGSYSMREKIDATASVTEIALQLDDVARMMGHIEGALSGPIQAQVSVSMSPRFARATSDANGWFEFDWPIGDVPELNVRWPEAIWNKPWAGEFWGTIRDEDAIMRVVRQESVLSIITSSSVNAPSQTLELWRRNRGGVLGRVIGELDSKSLTPLVLPPGDYELHQLQGTTRVATQLITLLAEERASIELQPLPLSSVVLKHRLPPGHQMQVDWLIKLEGSGATAWEESNRVVLAWEPEKVEEVFLPSGNYIITATITVLRDGVEPIVLGLPWEDSFTLGEGASESIVVTPDF